MTGEGGMNSIISWSKQMKQWHTTISHLFRSQTLGKGAIFDQIIFIFSSFFFFVSFGDKIFSFLSFSHLAQNFSSSGYLFALSFSLLHIWLDLTPWKTIFSPIWMISFINCNGGAGIKIIQSVFGSHLQPIVLVSCISWFNNRRYLATKMDFGAIELSIEYWMLDIGYLILNIWLWILNIAICYFLIVCNRGLACDTTTWGNWWS